MTLAAGGGNSVALLELEHRCGAGIVERLILVAPFSSGAPVDVKRSDAMNLDDGAIRDIAEHRAPLGNERVSASPYLLHRCTVEFLAHCEIEGSLHHSDVLIHRMFVGRNNRARKLADSHHERLAGNIRIAVDHLKVLRQRLEWDDTVLTRFRRVTHRGGGGEKHDDADRCYPGNSCAPHYLVSRSHCIGCASDSAATHALKVASATANPFGLTAYDCDPPSGRPTCTLTSSAKNDERASSAAAPL